MNGLKPYRYAIVYCNVSTYYFSPLFPKKLQDIISETSEVFFYTRGTPYQMVPLFQNIKNHPNINSFILSGHSLNLIHGKIKTLLPWEDNQCRLNLWNLGLRRYALYTSEQPLINFPYIRCDRITIYNLSFMHNVHDNFLQVFINPIGINVEIISDLIISRHCCGVGFWSKCWARWAAKVSEFYPTVPFDPHLGSVVTLSFWGCFYCLPHILKDIFFTSLCKLHNVNVEHVV